jgi:hypothetical protein
MKKLLVILVLVVLTTAAYSQVDTVKFKPVIVRQCEITSTQPYIVVLPFANYKDSVTVHIVSDEGLDSVYTCFINQGNLTDWGISSFKVLNNELFFTVTEFRPFDALAIQLKVKNPLCCEVTATRY